MSLKLINTRTSEVVADPVELAVTRSARRRGLLGRDRLGEREALLLSPCLAIHTAFMRFPIDVVFVDRRFRAVRLVHGLQPWRIAVWPLAHAVIELAAGRLRETDLRVGDTVAFGTVAMATRRDSGQAALERRSA